MTHQPNNNWRNRWLPGLLLIAATLVAYQPAWHAGFIWDDDYYVTHNSLLTAPDGLKRIWFSLDSPSQYFPLVYTTFRLERALWGLNSTGYHWVNILLHAANALLVWRLLRRLRVPGAWLAAAIFALHPVNVESVAWITQLKNVLSLFFCLLTLLAWVEFVEERRRWRWYGLAILCFALALASKTTACTLPAAFLLILWLAGKPIDRSRLAQVVPFVVLGVGMGLVSVWWERYHQGTEGNIYARGLLERILVASRAVWFYAGKLIWPSNLTFNYPLWKINPADPLAYSWLAAGAGLCAVVYFARRFVGRSAEVAAVYYVVILSPLLGFIMLYTFRYTFVADHYQYAACLGPIALAAAGISTAASLSGKKRPFLEPALCCMVLAVLGVLTWRQCGMYTDLETLWRTTIARNPNSSMAYNNLGIIYFNKGRMDEAMACCSKAVEIQPDSANAHFNLGHIFLRQGQLDEAVAHFQRVMEIQPNDAKAHSDLGLALMQKGQTDGAMAHCLKALEIQPGNADAHNNLGWILLQNGRVDEAISHFQEALKIRPGFALAHGNLAMAFIRTGRARDAIAQYQSFLKLQPDNAGALSSLAWVLATWPDASERNAAQAIDLVQRANQLTGGQDPMILGTLAAAYAEGGQFAEAVTTAQRALQLADARSNNELDEALRSQLKSYQAGAPFRDPGPTDAPAKRDQPIRP
jgi:type IV pilus biogenesis/stability protein PilW